jgi:hypothetical protein
MNKKLEEKHLASDYPKDDITSMTEAFFRLKPGRLSSKPEEDEYEGDRTAADFADAGARSNRIRAYEGN